MGMFGNAAARPSKSSQRNVRSPFQEIVMYENHTFVNVDGRLYSWRHCGLNAAIEFDVFVMGAQGSESLHSKRAAFWNYSDSIEKILERAKGFTSRIPDSCDLRVVVRVSPSRLAGEVEPFEVVLWRFVDPLGGVEWCYRK